MTVSATDFINALTVRESPKDSVAYNLSFATGRSGPSFGKVQLDLGSGNSHAVSAMENMLTASGFSSSQIATIEAAAILTRNISANTTSADPDLNPKSFSFFYTIGGGNVAAGREAWEQIDTILENNQRYIDAAASAQA